MIKCFLVRAALIFIHLFMRAPLLLVAGNALMSEGEILQCFGAIFGMGNAPVKVILLPKYSTLRPLVESLIDPPGFYAMFWNSCSQTGIVLLGQLVVAFLGAWGFTCLQSRGKKALSLLCIVLVMQPFQTTMVPNYLVLKRFYLPSTHPAVILPSTFSVFPVFIMIEFFEPIPKSFFEAAHLGGTGEVAIFMKVGIPVGKPEIVSILVLGFLEAWSTIGQLTTLLKERRPWPLSLYLPEIISDKVGVVWATSTIMMVPPVVPFMMGQELLEQGIAASEIKE